MMGGNAGASRSTASALIDNRREPRANSAGTGSAWRKRLDIADIPACQRIVLASVVIDEDALLRGHVGWTNEVCAAQLHAIDGAACWQVIACRKQCSLASRGVDRSVRPVGVLQADAAFGHVVAFRERQPHKSAGRVTSGLASPDHRVARERNGVPVRHRRR